MINMRTTTLLLGLLLLGGCKSSDIQQATEAGLILADVEGEQAKKISQGVGQATGAMAPMPFDTERAIGGGIAVQSFASQGRLHPDENLQKYVNTVGLSLVQESIRRDFPYCFAVVEQDGVNAWAAPGGYVFITTGALREMEDESMLAGVLGHEISHVNNAHMVQMMRREQFLSGVLTATEASLKNDIGRYTKTVQAGTGILFEKGIDRSMEYEADDNGSTLAALAGYEPDGLLRFLQRLNTLPGDKGGGWLQSTHPPLTERINKLRVKQESDFVGIDGFKARERFQKNVLSVLQSQAGK